MDFYFQATKTQSNVRLDCGTRHRKQVFRWHAIDHQFCDAIDPDASTKTVFVVCVEPTKQDLSQHPEDENLDYGNSYYPTRHRVLAPALVQDHWDHRD